MEIGSGGASTSSWFAKALLTGWIKNDRNKTKIRNAEKRLVYTSE
jgi:hypothetical protein